MEAPEQLDAPRLPVAAVRLERVEPGRVEVRDVDGGDAVDDPLGDDGSGAPAREDAQGVHPCRDEVVVELGRLADQEAVVRGEQTADAVANMVWTNGYQQGIQAIVEADYR